MKTALVMIAVTGLAAGRITGREFFAPIDPVRVTARSVAQ